MRDLPEGVTELLEAIIVPLATRYQLYFAGHALFGDPNAVKPRQFPTWAISKDDGNTIDNALKVGLIPSGGQDPFFSVGPDPQSTSTNCDFWTKVAGESIASPKRRRSLRVVPMGLVACWACEFKSLWTALWTHLSCDVGSDIRTARTEFGQRPMDRVWAVRTHDSIQHRARRAEGRISQPDARILGEHPAHAQLIKDMTQDQTGSCRL